ncbi:RNA polymerase sigma factor [Kitasatospora sp. NPDC051853]|uniref:RNA polymerase sigma factor n=1 Tax=Kitasatospora sp. NPDC051853 TaxID=3364058 RepID=UPI00378DD275
MESAAPPPSWDERIHRRLARGEETALAELYDRTAPLVHGLAGRILADQDAAEQLTREVFAQLWEHPESFDPRRGSLRAWLGALTRRRALDRLRLEHGPEGPPSRGRASEVVDALPGHLRETVALAWLDGHDYRETARRLGTDERTVKERLRRALQLVSGRACGGAGNCAQGNGSTCNRLTCPQVQASRLPTRAVPRAPEGVTDSPEAPQ